MLKSVRHIADLLGAKFVSSNPILGGKEKKGRREVGKPKSTKSEYNVGVHPCFCPSLGDFHHCRLDEYLP
jgi:hypothetical protein